MKNFVYMLVVGMSVLVLTGCKSVEKDLPTHDDGSQVIINVFGDSYVKNHRRPYEEAWHYKAATELGMKYNNYGRNGSCVAFDRSKEGFGPAMTVRYKELDPSADIVLIIAGHNDAYKVGDNPQMLEQFRDSVGILIDHLREQCPKAKIGWVTPWYVDYEGFIPVVNTIKAVCKKKHVPVMDNYAPKCVIQVRDASFRKQYFQGENDMAHLNAAGHDLFKEEGKKFIKKVMKSGK